MPTLLLVAAVAAAALAFGWPTRHGEFLSGDDQRFVVEQVLVNHPSPRHAWKLLTMVHGDLYQPLPMLSFQANYALADPAPEPWFGISPYGFHLTNILLHTLNAALASLVVLRLAGCRRIALLAGLMFACHPLALEPVAWISGRMILLATTFSLSLLLTCLSRRADGGGAWPWLGGLWWLSSLLCKVLPSVPVAVGWCDYLKHGRLPRRAWMGYGGLLIMAAAGTWLAASTSARFGMIAGTEAESTTAAGVRIILAGRYYLESYICPSRMSAWSPPPEEVALLSGEAGVALVEFAVFGGLLWIAWRGNRLSFMGLGLFVILLLPFLGATFGRRMLAADRYLYLPMLGLHLAAAAAVMQVMDYLGRRLRRPLAVGLVAVPCVVMLAAWMSLGWQHADDWRNTIARDRRLVEVYPDRVEVRVELARAYVFARDADAALEVVAAARGRWPDNSRLASEAGEAYRLKEDWQNAARELAEAVKGMPHRARTHYHYALTLEELGRVDEARAGYRKIIEEDSGFLPAVTALARSYQSSGELDAAIAMFERAARINPFHRDSLFELALLHLRRQDWRSAEARLRAILEVDPEDAPALLNLGVALARQDETAGALAIYDRLITLDPAGAAARINRAGLLAAMGRFSEAEEEYRHVLAGGAGLRARSADRHGHRGAAIGLHEVLQRQERYGELAALWQGVGRSDHDSGEWRAWLTWAYVLAGDGEAARRAMASIPPSAAHRPFADWALAFEALREGDEQAVRRHLGRPLGWHRRLAGGLCPPHGVASSRREQARAVIAALSTLLPDVQASPVGYYALARAMLFDGDASLARKIALQVMAMPAAGQWSSAAQELIDVVDGRGTKGPSEESRLKRLARYA